MNKHPNFECTFQGANILLSRRSGSSSARGEVAKRWELTVDGRMVEELMLSKESSRDLSGMKEGSYQIATHFTPTDR